MYWVLPFEFLVSKCRAGLKCSCKQEIGVVIPVPYFLSRCKVCRSWTHIVFQPGIFSAVWRNGWVAAFCFASLLWHGLWLLAWLGSSIVNDSLHFSVLHVLCLCFIGRVFWSVEKLQLLRLSSFFFFFSVCVLSFGHRSNLVVSSEETGIPGKWQVVCRSSCSSLLLLLDSFSQRTVW